MLYFIVFVVGIICGLIISFMVEENRKIQRLKDPKTYTLDEIEAELGLTEELNDKAAFEAGYTKAQMELKDAYKPKKGKWIPVTNGRGGHECDQCHEYAPSWQTGEEHLTNYCPNCGARMEE